MVQLTALGTADLRDGAGTPVTALLRQPRRFALLTYLALESRRGAIRRDRVLNVFWPEVPEWQGRRALSQALHYLRRSLGTDLVHTVGAEDVQLDSSRFSCDVCDFLTHLEERQPEAALRLYRGDLLPAFHGGVADFEDWLDRKRDELRRLAAEAAWQASAFAADGGEVVAAGVYARRAVELTGGDEPATRRLMELLAKLGDRAGALEAYDVLAERLHREYEAAPATSTRALAERIRGSATGAPHPVAYARARVRGGTESDVVATGDAVEGEAEGLVAEAGDPLLIPTTAVLVSPAPEVAAGPGRLRSTLVSAGLAAAFISLWGLSRGGERAAPAAVGDAEIVVQETRGPAEIAERVTSEIVRQLSEGDRIRVLLEPIATVQVANDLSFLLRTIVSSDTDSLRATVILTDRRTGAAITSMRMAQAADPRVGAERLGATIVSFARRATGMELERRSAELADVAPAALAAWQRAHRDLAAADSLLDAGLAEAARVRLKAADALLARAQDEDGDWVQVPLERGELELVRMWLPLSKPDGGWPEARRALMAGVDHADQALRIAPRNPRALELRGVLQAMLWLSTPADSVMRSNPNLEAAHRDLDRATQYSSAAPRAWQYLSMILFARGEYALAYHAADRALEADAFLSDAAGVHAQHFWAALEVGDTTGARECCSQQNANDPDSWQGSYCRLVLLAWSGKPAADSSAVVRLVNTAQQKPYAEQNGGALDAVHAVLLAQRGDSIGARGLLGEVLRRADSRPDLLYHAAWVHATLGERDAARDLLERYVAGWPAARAGIARSQRFVGLLN